MSDERFQILYDFQVQDQKLDRTAKLIDQLNLGLERSTRALRGFETASGSFNRIGDGAKVATSKVLDLAAALNVAGTVARAVGGGVSAVYGGLDRFGAGFIKAAGERSSTVRSYTTLLGGDKRLAELEFYRAQQFAQKTDFTSATVEKAQSQLIAQGFRGNDLYRTLFGAADLSAAAAGDKNQALEGTVRALGQIKAKGRLQSEEINQLTENAPFSRTLLIEELRKSLKLKDSAAVDKALRTGISADVGIEAFQRTVLAQLGTKKLGEFSTNSAGSLTSLLSNRDEAFQNLSKAFDADQALPAIGRYKKALTEETALYDVNGKKGKDLALVLQDIANATTNAKAGLSELTAAFTDSFSESYALKAIQEGRDFNTESTTEALHNLGTAIGRLGSLAATAVGGTNGLVGNIAQRAANAVNNSLDIGEDIRLGEYRKAAQKTGRLLLDNTIGGIVAQNTLPYRIAENAYHRVFGNYLESSDKVDEEFRASTDLYGPFTSDHPAYGTRALTEAARRATDLSGGRGYSFKGTETDKASKIAKSVEDAERKAKKARGFDELLTNYETPAFQGKGIGGSVSGVDAINSVVENSLASGRSDERAIIVNQQVNITVPNSEIAQRVAGELRNARDSIADELRTLSRAPRAAARK